MSGGVAYVYDEDGLFVRRCNPEMVELETVDGDDAIALRALVEEHARAHRQQARRRRCSPTGTAALRKMVKVMPSEYRRVIAEQAKMPETAGLVGDIAPRPYHSWRDGRASLRAVRHG